MNDLPIVSAWKPLPGGVWAKVAEIATYETLRFMPQWLAGGDWSMSLPYDTQALALAGDRLVTVDWRGARSTWCIGTFEPAADPDTGAPVLTVGGPGALSYLGRAVAYPNPTGTLAQQPRDKLYSGPAETVIRDLIADNLRDRYGLPLVIPTSLGRGGATTARCRFDNLYELIATKAKTANLGVDVGLVNEPGTTTRARLTVRFYQPVDRSKRVRLSYAVGTLGDWKQTGTAPTATKAIVGGAGEDVDRVFAQTTTPDGDAAAAAWGGHREVFVDGPATFDSPELVQAGQEQITEGAATETLTLTAAEAEGLLAFRDYNVGDTAHGEVLTGASVTDVITAIAVEIGLDGITVKPTFGDPDAAEPILTLARMIQQLRAHVRALETRR